MLSETKNQLRNNNRRVKVLFVNNPLIEGVQKEILITAIKINRIAPGPPPIPPVEMKIDRPYYFVIRHKQLNITFFEGNVEVPQFNNVANPSV